MDLTDQVRRYLLVYDTIRKKGPVSLDRLTREVENRSALFAGDEIAKSRSTMLRITRALKEDVGLRSSKRGYEFETDEREDEWLFDSLDLLDKVYYDDRLRDFVLCENRRMKGTEHVAALVRAIKFSLRVSFRYRKYDNSEGRVRVVEPYALKEYRNRWYLLSTEVGGRLDEVGTFKTWGLDRISDLTVSSDKFSRNADLDVNEEFRSCVGIYSDADKPVEEVILSFPPMGGRYNAAFPLHESQRTIVENDREFRIGLRVRITYDFVMELLSQSQDMTVIAPQHLKDELAAIYRQAIRRMESGGETE